MGVARGVPEASCLGLDPPDSVLLEPAGLRVALRGQVGDDRDPPGLQDLRDLVGQRSDRPLAVRPDLDRVVAQKQHVLHHPLDGVVVQPLPVDDVREHRPRRAVDADEDRCASRAFSLVSRDRHRGAAAAGVAVAIREEPVVHRECADRPVARVRHRSVVRVSSAVGRHTAATPASVREVRGVVHLPFLRRWSARQSPGNDRGFFAQLLSLGSLLGALRPDRRWRLFLPSARRPDRRRRFHRF